MIAEFRTAFLHAGHLAVFIAIVVGVAAAGTGFVRDSRILSHNFVLKYGLDQSASFWAFGHRSGIAVCSHSAKAIGTILQRLAANCRAGTVTLWEIG